MTQTNASWDNAMLSASPTPLQMKSNNNNSNILLNQVLVLSSAGGIHSSLAPRQSSSSSSNPNDGNGIENNDALDHDLDTVKLLLAHRHAQRWGKLKQQQLLGKGNKKSAMSTSALTNVMQYNQNYYENNSNNPELSPSMTTNNDGGNSNNAPYHLRPQKLKLSKDALLSLGIRKKPKVGKSILKKEGDMGPRRSTMTNLHEIEVTLPTGEKLRRNASITFNEACRVKRIPSNDQLKPSTKQALWYQKDEFDTMWTKNQKIIKKANKGQLRGGREGSKTLNVRGLERYLDNNLEESRARKVDTWDAVIWAQHDCCDDEAYIAAMSREYSSPSMVEAQRRAKDDATDALRIHQADPVRSGMKAIRSYDSLIPARP